MIHCTMKPVIEMAVTHYVLSGLNPVQARAPKILVDAAEKSPEQAKSLLAQLSSEAAFLGNVPKRGHGDGVLDVMALSALRYSLGRMTYVPSCTVDWLCEIWSLLENDTQQTIVDEIKIAIAGDRTGEKIDQDTWKRLLGHAESVAVSQNETRFIPIVDVFAERKTHEALQ